MARKLTDQEQRLFAEALVRAEVPDAELLDQDAIARLLNANVRRSSGTLSVDWHCWTQTRRVKDPSP